MMSSVGSVLGVAFFYLSLLGGVLYLWFYWTHRRLLKMASKLPLASPALPLIGHSYFAFWGKAEMTRQVLEMTKKVVAEGIKTTCFYCGPLPIVAVHDKDDIQTILNSSNTTDKGDEYAFFRVGFDSDDGPMNHSLLTAPGHMWRVTRKHMNPLFHPRNVQHMTTIFNSNSRALVSCLSDHVGKGAFNVMDYTMDISLKTVCELLYGPGTIDIDIKSKEFKGLVKVVEAIPNFFILRLLRPWLRIESVFRFLYRKELKELNTSWNNFTNPRLQVIKEKNKMKAQDAALLKDKDGEDEDLPSANDDEPVNFLEAFSALQRNHPQFTEADMRYEMLTFYCTGTDTVGSGVASCLLALATFQDIQEKLYKEVMSVVPVNEDITLEDLDRMPYLEQVIKESLRWFLIVPYTLRKTSKDVLLSTCTIPSGNTVIVALAGIHLDPKIYPEPYKFDPDRFSPDNPLVKERGAFVPFSGGSRNCIAKHYAMHLMKIQLIHVLRKFKLSTQMDMFNLRKRLIVTLVSADGYNVSLEERN